MLGQTGLGYLSRVRSIAEGFVTGGLATMLVLPLLLVLRRRGEPADYFEGHKAGLRKSCAAQGMAEISQIGDN